MELWVFHANIIEKNYEHREFSPKTHRVLKCRYVVTSKFIEFDNCAGLSAEKKLKSNCSKPGIKTFYSTVRFSNGSVPFSAHTDPS